MEDKYLDILKISCTCR